MVMIQEELGKLSEVGFLDRSVASLDYSSRRKDWGMTGRDILQIEKLHCLGCPRLLTEDGILGN